MSEETRNPLREALRRRTNSVKLTSEKKTQIKILNLTQLTSCLNESRNRISN